MLIYCFDLMDLTDKSKDRHKKWLHKIFYMLEVHVIILRIIDSNKLRGHLLPNKRIKLANTDMTLMISKIAYNISLQFFYVSAQYFSPQIYENCTISIFIQRL